MFGSWEISGKEKNVKENDFLMISLWKNIKRKLNIIKINLKFIYF